MTDITNYGDWAITFQQNYNRAIIRYRSGARDATTSFPDADVKFLRSIGCTPHELHDFVEDWCDDGVPTFEIVLQITAIQREYFLKERQSQPSTKTTPISSFPGMNEKLGGYRWLPRIIAKARAKLRGELPKELMYNCGRDRQFLKMVKLKAPEFLKVVWESGSNDLKILEYVQKNGNPPDASITN